MTAVHLQQFVCQCSHEVFAGEKFGYKCVTHSVDYSLHNGVVVEQHVDNRRPQVAIFFRRSTGSSCFHNGLPTRARSILWCLRFLAFLSRVRHRDNDYYGASLTCSVHNENEDVRGYKISVARFYSLYILHQKSVFEAIWQKLP